MHTFQFYIAYISIASSILYFSRQANCIFVMIFFNFNDKDANEIKRTYDMNILIEKTNIATVYMNTKKDKKTNRVGDTCLISSIVLIKFNTLHSSLQTRMRKGFLLNRLILNKKENRFQLNNESLMKSISRFNIYVYFYPFMFYRVSLR
jgi:hypothetical protein